MNYSVRLISEPYHYYEKDNNVRLLMSDIFRNQLRGYKAYYPEGVCPISEYDFFTNHIAILDADSNEVICSFKIIELDVCKNYNKKFPLSLLLGEDFPEQNQAVETWLLSHPNTGYNHSWTIKPDLPKEIKKELGDITFALLAQFYIERNISNMIDVSIMPFKIHLTKEWMGNKYLKTPPFEVKEYGEKLGCLMVNEGLVFRDEFRFVINKYKKLWNSRIEYNPSNYIEEKKAA